MTRKRLEQFSRNLPPVLNQAQEKNLDRSQIQQNTCYVKTNPVLKMLLAISRKILKGFSRCVTPIPIRARENDINGSRIRESSF